MHLSVITNFFKKHYLLVFIVLLTVSLRLFPIFPDYFSFMYDHAKDSLIIMEMGTKFKPSLVGAVTSIPGVYYGPLWYYLALPLNFIFSYHPLASVLTVILLSAVSVIFIHKYFGHVAAIFYAVSFGLIGTQTSAWSPYLTTFIVLPVVSLLLNIKRRQKVSTKVLFFLAFLSSLMFHLQPAFGVVLMPIVVMTLILKKITIKFKQILFGIVSFLSPFIFHLIFELRHNFHQTKQVIAFFSDYATSSHVIEPNQAGINRILQVGYYILDTAGRSVLSSELPFGINFIWIGLVVLAWFIWASYKKRISTSEFVTFSTFLMGILILYQFFPAKSYYLVAVIPVWILIFASLIKTHFSKKTQNLILTVVIFLSLIQSWTARNHYQSLAQSDSFPLQPKIKAIEKIHQLSQGQPFNSYHFVPEVYDYTYQYLYRYLATKDYPYPIEFSYKPGHQAYMKLVSPELVSDQSIGIGQDKETEFKKTFLIVEKPVRQQVQDQWWHEVAAAFEIMSEHKINNSITVYEVK